MTSTEYRWRKKDIDNELVRVVMSDAPDFAQIRALVKKGGSLNSTGTFGESVLMELVGLKGGEGLTLELVKLLVELGSDVHHADDEGGTVLYEACLTCRPDLVRYFLELGLDPNIEVDGGETLIESVKADVEMSAMDRDRAAQRNEALHTEAFKKLQADAKGHAEIFALLKEAGAEASELNDEWD